MDVLEQRTKRFTEGALLPVLLRLALPVIASITLQTLYQLVNAFWLGRVSATAVAVVSVTTPLTLLLVVLGSGLSTAGLILVAQFSGARNRPMVNRVAAQTMVMVVAVSLVLCVVGLLATQPVLRAMSVAPDVFAGATDYLSISYARLTASYAFVMGQSILQGAGEVRFPLMVVAASVVLNAVLDPVLIFGWGGVPPLGVAGAAWATVGSQAVAAVIGITPLFTGRFGIRIRRADFGIDPALLRTALAIALPASIEQSTRTLASLLLTALAARFGTDILASFGLGMRIIMLFFIPALGLSAATATLVGQNLGAGLAERARSAARVSGLFAFAALTVAGLLFMPVTASVAGMLVPTDASVVRLATSFVLVVAPAFGIIAAQQVFAGAFRGAGQTLQAMMLSLIMQWGFQLPISFAFSYYSPLGFRALWWGFPLGNALALAVTLVWFRNSHWQARTR
ncbi:MAG: MatE family transporter [Gammaproteobacteria bacterium]|nr:MatE family transporter [Gammaproteobacteria bacterium]